jgi:hypothetical protein
VSLTGWRATKVSNANPASSTKKIFFSMIAIFTLFHRETTLFQLRTTTISTTVHPVDTKQVHCLLDEAAVIALLCQGINSK